MAAVATGKSWRDFFEKNVHLPAAFDREHAAQDISTPICINLTSVEGINPKVRLKFCCFSFCRACACFQMNTMFIPTLNQDKSSHTFRNDNI